LAISLSTTVRIHYNLGLLLCHLKRGSEAEVALTRAMTLEPDNMDYLYVLADYYALLKGVNFVRQSPLRRRWLPVILKCKSAIKKSRKV